MRQRATPKAQTRNANWWQSWWFHSSHILSRFQRPPPPFSLPPALRFHNTIGFGYFSTNQANFAAKNGRRVAKNSSEKKSIKITYSSLRAHLRTPTNTIITGQQPATTCVSNGDDEIQTVIKSGAIEPQFAATWLHGGTHSRHARQ